MGHLSISESLGAYLQHDVINFTLLSSLTLEVVLLCSDARDGVVAIACMSGHMMSRLRDDAVTSDSSLMTMRRHHLHTLNLRSQCPIERMHSAADTRVAAGAVTV